MPTKIRYQDSQDRNFKMTLNGMVLDNVLSYSIENTADSPGPTVTITFQATSVNEHPSDRLIDILADDATTQEKLPFEK